MKVLQIISHYVPAYRYGGPLHVAHGLGKALLKAGHSVTVCTTNLSDDSNDLPIPLDIPVSIDGLEVYYEPTRLSRYWGFSPRLFLRARREIIKADVVLIHAHYQFANWIGAVLSRKARKPYVIFSHGSLHLQGIAHKSKLLKRAYLRTMEDKNLKKALFIAFNAPEEKIQSLYSDNGKIINNGIDPDAFAQMPPSGYFRSLHPQLRGKIFVLFMGRLDIQHKGLDLLIPAFSQFREKFTNAHLVIAGADENGGATQIQQMIAENGLSSNVTITGLIWGIEKLAALKDANIFVLSSRFEGLSIALLEALYVGLPVLVTDKVGLSTEIKRVGAGLVVAPEIKQLCTGLNKLAETSFSNSMRMKATDLIRQKFTWDAIADNLVIQIRQSMVAHGY